MEIVIRCDADLIKTLLFFIDFDLESLVSSELVVSLASSLAACIQLNSLSAENRTWALLRLRQLLLSPHGPCINIAGLLGSHLQPSDEFCKVKPCTNPVMDAVSLMVNSFYIN